MTRHHNQSHYIHPRILHRGQRLNSPKNMILSFYLEVREY